MFIFLLIFFVILKIYFPWFEAGKNLSNGDWPYLFLENIREFSFLPHQSVFWLTPYYQITAKIFTQYLGFPWELVERVFWFWPFLGLSIFSSYYLTKSWLGVLIYVTNTYALMLVGGGQMGVALSYSLAPLVLGKFIHVINSERIALKAQGSRLKDGIISGLVLAVQVMWDPRMAYITIGGAGLYWIINLLFINGLTSYRKVKTQNSKLKATTQNLKLFWKNLGLVFGIPLLITTGLHAFWILPMIMGGFSGIESFGEAYTTPGAVKFFSFASFSNTLSLLHPNWPENIFGKVYFMRGEFLILPILAFSSLLFINQLTSSRVKEFKNSLINNSLIKNKTILYFNLLALIGAFLAKGANPPFGEVYLWLFDNFPGFVMFRDPTKFYLLVSLSYSVLIPYSLSGIEKLASSKLKAQNSKLQLKAKNLLIFTFLAYWLFLIRPAWMGELGGTFKTREVPAEYMRLKDFLHNQPEFFRTFWVPRWQRFGFFSNNHPAIDAMDILKISSSSVVVDWLKSDKAKEQLSGWGVKYVIVPYDNEGEIFLEDREYSEEERRRVEEDLKMVKWLKWLDGWEKIAVFEVAEYNELID